MLNKVLFSLTVLYQSTNSQQPPWVPSNPSAPAGVPPGLANLATPTQPVEVPPGLANLAIPTQPVEVPPTLPTIVTIPQIPITIPQIQTTTTTTSTTLAPDPVVVVTPETTLPLLPPGSRYGAYGQICGTPQPSSQCLTTMPPSFAYDNGEGFMRCDRTYDCCLCAQITCNNCNTFSAGISGVYGVKNIQIMGRDPAVGGADINCLGVESCAESIITAQNIKAITASNAMAAKNAQIVITNPVEFFQIDCSAMGACEGLNIELIFPGPPAGESCSALISGISPFYLSGVHCGAQDSCKDMTFTVRNDACTRVIMQDLNCIATGACTNAVMNFIGDVVIENCDLGPSGATMLGVDKCYENLQQILCPDPRSCLGQTRTLLNPVQGFAMKCGGEMSCAGAQFTIRLTNPYYGALMGRPGGAVEHLDGFWFSGPYAAAGATIIIDNQQGGAPVVIERIECGTSNACAGTTFIIGANVNVNDIECGTNDSCRGCVIKYFASDPGFPCDPTQV